jgi:transposase
LDLAYGRTVARSAGALWPAGTVSSRYYRWHQKGIWDRIFAELQAQADQDGNLDWSVHFVDSTVIRAHQHAAGAKRGTQNTKRWVAPRVGSPPS